MKNLVEKMNISQAVCESRESDNVVRFMNDNDLSIEFILAYQNGDVWGAYYDEDGDLVYEVNAAMNHKEEVTELSWWDLHKWEVFLLVIIVSAFGIGILIYKYRK